MPKNRRNAYIYLIVGIINLISAITYLVSNNWQGWLFLFPGLIWIFVGYYLLKNNNSKQNFTKNSKL